MRALALLLLCLSVSGCIPYFYELRQRRTLQTKPEAESDRPSESSVNPSPRSSNALASEKSSTSSVVRVSVESLPYTNSFQMIEGDACLFVLPSKRTVALWVTEGRTAGEHGTKAGLRCNWSEKPFLDIPLMRNDRPRQEGQDVEWKSYIEQGPVIVHGKDHIEKHLYVDDVLFRYWQSKQSSPHLAVKVDITKRKQDHQP